MSNHTAHYLNYKKFESISEALKAVELLAEKFRKSFLNFSEVNNLLKCMRVKWLGAKCGVDKITIKEDVLRFVFFKSKSEDVKTRTFKNIVDIFENMKNKYSVVDISNQIIIKLFCDLNLEKTLKILKKTSN